MCRGQPLSLEAADAEVESAHLALAAALRASWHDEGATERIAAAARRLRDARLSRTAAARSGMSHMPELLNLV